MPPHGPSRGFVGRSEQLERFRLALDEASAGHPSTLLVIGEAGVGKTRLVEQCAALAAAAGAARVVGHCVRLEHASFPYAPVIEAVRGLVRERGGAEVARLLGPGQVAFGGLVSGLEPSGTPAPGEWGQGQLFEAMLGLLERLGGEGPGVVAVFEDLHWADGATLELLNYVVRNLAGSRVVTILTARDDVPGGHLVRTWTAELSRLEQVERLELRPFGRRETAELLALRGGSSQPAALVEDIFRRSDGNAFLIEELFAAARHGDGAAPTLRDTVHGRVGALTAPARRVLDVVAVAGGQVGVELLRAVLGDEADVAGPLGDAVEAQVLVGAGDGYEFRHAAYAEAVYDELLPVDRRRLHTALATAIEQEPLAAGAGHQAQLARHWLAAGALDRALPASIAAAEAAEAVHAPAEALAHWEAALRLAETVEWPRRSLVRSVDLPLRTAEAANRAGAIDRAVALVEVALTGAAADVDARRAGHLQERLGWYRTRQGDEAGAEVAYKRALALVPAEPPSAERARAFTAMARFCSRQGRDIEARQWSEDAVSCAVAAGAVADEGHARHALGLALGATGELDAAYTELAVAARLAEQGTDLAELAWTCLHLQKIASDAGRLGDAVDLLLDRSADARRRGLGRTFGDLLDCLAAGALVELGRWAAADELVTAVAARRPSGLQAATLDLVRGYLDVGQGRFADAEERLRSVQGFALGLRDGRVGGLLYTALAEVARWQGRLDEAAATATEGIEAISYTGDDDMLARLCVTAIRVEADRRAQPHRIDGPARGAGPFLETLKRLATRGHGPAPSTGVLAAAAEGEAEAAREEGIADPQRWRTALAVAARLGNPYDEARLRYRLADALLGTDDRGAAGEELQRAAALAGELGAQPLLERIDELARRAQLGPRAAARRGDGRSAGALTQREQDVLRLLAAGRTNRQIASALFISEKTASVHVSRILAKLGVATRGEAAALAHARGLAT